MNTQTHQGEVVILIYHQILVTNKQVIVLQLDGRIKNQILGVKVRTLWFFFKKPLTIQLP